MREYEIVYILDSALSQEDVDARLEGFHAALDGEVTAVDHWGVRQLAYPIRKLRTGYYVVVQVTADPTVSPSSSVWCVLTSRQCATWVVLKKASPHPAPRSSPNDITLRGAGKRITKKTTRTTTTSTPIPASTSTTMNPPGPPRRWTTAKGAKRVPTTAGEETPGEEDVTADAEGRTTRTKASRSSPRDRRSSPVPADAAAARRPSDILLNYKDVAHAVALPDRTGAASCPSAPPGSAPASRECSAPPSSAPGIWRCSPTFAITQEANAMVIHSTPSTPTQELR